MSRWSFPSRDMGTWALHRGLPRTSPSVLYCTGLVSTVCFLSVSFICYIMTYYSFDKDAEHYQGNLMTVKTCMSDVRVRTPILFARDAKWVCYMRIMALLVT
jgi:hypothetical protein